MCVCVCVCAARHPEFKPLLAVMGCPRLGRMVSQLLPDVHIFGHSHVSFDEYVDLVTRSASSTSNSPIEQATVNNEEPDTDSDSDKGCHRCRFIQQALGYPQERKMRAHYTKQRQPLAQPKAVWSSQHGDSPNS